MAKINTRLLACEKLLTLFQEQKPLTTHQDPRLSAKDNAFISECCFGVTRFYIPLSHIADQLLKKPLANRDFALYLLLLLGLYQLKYMKLPVHAVLFETVQAAKHSKRPWASSLLNACLHQYLRHPIKLDLPLYNSPLWLVKRIQTHWNLQAPSILELHEHLSPMTLRLDLHQSSLHDYQAFLAQQGISATPHPLVPTALVLEKPCAVDLLPGFKEGLVSIQDASSQLAALFLKPQAGDVILDACSAPGSKTGHLWQYAQGNIQLVATDSSSARMQKLEHTIQRLHIQATLHTLPAQTLSEHYPKEHFDKILLDVPCSGTGVIRRHPDILILRTPEQIQELLFTQKLLLRALWPLLKPGGSLLYTTCSLLPEENEEQIAQFMEETKEAVASPLLFAGGIPLTYGLQILTQAQLDGFYFALLIKHKF